MGIFGFGKSKQEEKANVIIGYLRTETSRLTNLPLNSKEYANFCAAATFAVKTSLLKQLNKESQQKIVDTFAEHCGKRQNEAFGEYLILLFVRNVHIQKAIEAGAINAEEATIGVLCDAIHREIKRLV